ncbi:13570_t:CDS:2, partial [Cetraspora pellucida]
LVHTLEKKIKQKFRDISNLNLELNEEKKAVCKIASTDFLKSFNTINMSRPTRKSNQRNASNSSQGNILKQNQRNVLKTSQKNVPKPKEDNIPESSQENAPHSTRKKILKHKSLPLVRNNTGSFVKTQAQYNKENISLSEANQIVKRSTK